MSERKYWSITVLGVIAIFVGLFWWMQPREVGTESEVVETDMVINQVEPVRGPVGGGESVVFLGENFPEEVEVWFGNKKAEEVLRYDETVVVAILTTAEEVGKVGMLISTKDGEGIMAPVEFEYVEASELENEE